MEVNYAFLCDYATVSKEGKLSILGIFQNINVRALPQAFIAFELELNYAEVGHEHSIRLQCVDADGNHLFQTDGKMAFEGDAPFGKSVRIANVVRLNNVRFNRAGEHNINLFVDDRLEKQIEFTVTDIEEGGPPQIEASEPPSG